MAGVFEIGHKVPVAVAIEELVLIAEGSLDGEWEGQVRYLPCGRAAGFAQRGWKPCRHRFVAGTRRYGYR